MTKCPMFIKNNMTLEKNIMAKKNMTIRMEPELKKTSRSFV